MPTGTGSTDEGMPQACRCWDRAEGEGKMSELEPTPELPDKTPIREIRFPTRIKNGARNVGRGIA